MNLCPTGTEVRKYLWQISVLVVDACHAVQPGLAELGRAGVGLGQAVLEVHQHLRVVLVLLHLLGGHQHCPDALGEVLHVGGKRRVLQNTTATNQAVVLKAKKKCISFDLSPPTHLDALVTVGTVVDDGERLLEAGSPDADDICNQLTDSNNHLHRRGHCICLQK